MTHSTEPQGSYEAATGRPIRALPRSQLVRISVYWLGLSSIFAGLHLILGNRLLYDGLVANDDALGAALFRLTILGALIAVVVQPTVGAISDYTVSRWGRRKPFIFVGTILDVVFLTAIALSHELIAIAAFVALLQFSSNLAQGPFQGYVPDLVPEPQVGTASALVGMMQVFGNVTGYVVAAIASARGEFAIGLIALGLVELVTMLSVVIRVRDPHPPLRRHSRSWVAIARSAWATDLLREHSFLWLLGSRLAILMAGGVLTGLGIFYVARSLQYDQDLANIAIIPVIGLVALGTLISVVPAARLSDRVGRKRVIWAACGLGALGLALVALAPSVGPTPGAVLERGHDGDLLSLLLMDPRYIVALAGVVAYGLSAGAFLAVDWALITDIIPKASSGRYMGISNVATASSGVLAIAIGGWLMDSVAAADGAAAGPVAAMWAAVLLLGLGAMLLIPVDERRRDETAPAEATALPGSA